MCISDTDLQDLQAEKAAEQAAAQAAADSLAQAKKRKAVSGKLPVAIKKPKMASVQQLHMSESTAGTQSGSGSQSQSAGFDRRKRAGSLSMEASSLPESMHMANKLQAPQMPESTVRALSGIEQDADAISELDKDGKSQQQSAAAAASDMPSASSLAEAKQNDEPMQAGKRAAEGVLTNVKEYFVKWKGKSFIHCSWVKHDDVVKVAGHSTGLNMRFKHYQRSVYGMPEVTHHSLSIHQACSAHTGWTTAVAAFPACLVHVASCLLLVARPRVLCATSRLWNCKQLAMLTSMPLRHLVLTSNWHYELTMAHLCRLLPQGSWRTRKLVTLSMELTLSGCLWTESLLSKTRKVRCLADSFCTHITRFICTVLICSSPMEPAASTSSAVCTSAALL